jgi:hypothetical protein
MAFYIKQNDTFPAIRSIIRDGDDVAINLIDATVRFHMREAQTNELVVDELALIVSEAGGIVEYQWQAGDTAAVGWYKAEWQVTYGSDFVGVETFPSEGYIWVKIEGEVA